MTLLTVANILHILYSYLVRAAKRKKNTALPLFFSQAMYLNIERQLWQNQREASTCSLIAQELWKKSKLRSLKRALRGGYLVSILSFVIYSPFLHFIVSVVCDLSARKLIGLKGTDRQLTLQVSG